MSVHTETILGLPVIIKRNWGPRFRCSQIDWHSSVADTAPVAFEIVGAIQVVAGQSMFVSPKPQHGPVDACFPQLLRWPLVLFLEGGIILMVRHYDEAPVVLVRCDNLGKPSHQVIRQFAAKP